MSEIHVVFGVSTKRALEAISESQRALARSSLNLARASRAMQRAARALTVKRAFLFPAAAVDDAPWRGYKR